MNRARMTMPRLLCLAILIASAIALPARAIVNPSLQPDGILERYLVVVVLRVDAVDELNHTATMSVMRVIKGDFPAKRVNITLGETTFSVGEQVLAYVGGKGRASAKNILIYPGGGLWKTAQILVGGDPASPKWRWIADLSRSEMGGTFNGHVERLAEMMDDAVAGRYFFPALSAVQFRSDLVVDRLPQALLGVAIFDVNGDGQADLYACSDGGDRVYLQTASMVFTESSKALGIEGVASASVNIADVNADGRPDLLAGRQILLQMDDGIYYKSEVLPAAATQQIKSSAFVELNGDGYPDVLIARLEGGLHAFLNPGAAGGAFSDATVQLGLDREECGAKQVGFFCAGDWDGDGRTDLFFAVDRGRFLIQQTNGTFLPLPNSPRLNFKTGGESLGLTGAGCFAPLWTPTSSDLIVSTDGNMRFVVNEAGQARDYARYGNEIEEGSDAHLATIAEDLDADGNVDVYCASREDNMHMLYINRGHGSFTVPTKYRKGDNAVFPGEASARATWGVATGDVDGDGANDLLLGMADGSLVLLINEVLSRRFDRTNPTWHEQKLQATKIVSVTVTGRIGVLGAKIILSDAKGVVGQRVIGANIATGCRGPDTINLAVRETAGGHRLTVRFSDGTIQEWPVDLSGPERHLRILAERKP